MRRRLLILGVVALLTIGFAVPIAAQAGWIDHWSGESAGASFYRTEGDVYTEIWVDAMDGKYQSPPGNGEVFSSVYLHIYSYDVVTGDTLVAAWGSKDLAPKDFVVAGGLKSATLKATVPMYDWAGDESFDASVVIDWTAVGRAARDSYVSHYIYPGMHYTSRGSNTWRDATADVRITADGDVLVAGRADYASISSGRNRTTSVY